MRRALLRGLVVAGLATTSMLALAGTAAAHPLGNFSTNTHSALVVEPSTLHVDVVVDRAEIPTRQSYPRLDDRTGTLPADERASAAAAQCAAVRDQAELDVAGRRVALDVTGTDLTFPPGAAGLRTARLTCRLEPAAGDVDVVGSRVRYRLSLTGVSAGWREVVATGDGVRLARSDVPERTSSDALRSYPDDLLSSPLDVDSATFDVVAGSGVASGVGALLGDGPAAALPRGVARIDEAFTGLVAQDRLTLPFGLLAFGAALLLGGLHAFAPGHGKTVMAAVLVGGRGGTREALLIGGSVTLTHTAGVLALGIVLTGVGAAAPTSIYPWLGLLSGLLLVGIGMTLLRAASRRRNTWPEVAEPVPALAGVGTAVAGVGHSPHGVAHQHQGHTHAHDPQDGHGHHRGDGHHHRDDHHHDRLLPTAEDAARPHSHGWFTHTHPVAPAASGVRGLVAVGFAGGLVPSPSALIVLLGGIALGRAWFGATLVVAYGVGMAAALVGTGLLLVHARHRLSALVARTDATHRYRRAARALQILPMATAAVVVLVGTAVLARAAVQIT